MGKNIVGMLLVKKMSGLQEPGREKVSYERFLVTNSHIVGYFVVVQTVDIWFPVSQAYH